MLKMAINCRLATNENKINYFNEREQRYDTTNVSYFSQKYVCGFRMPKLIFNYLPIKVIFFGDRSVFAVALSQLILELELLP